MSQVEIRAVVIPKRVENPYATLEIDDADNFYSARDFSSPEDLRQWALDQVRRWDEIRQRASTLAKEINQTSLQPCEGEVARYQGLASICQQEQGGPAEQFAGRGMLEQIVTDVRRKAVLLLDTPLTDRVLRLESTNKEAFVCALSITSNAAYRTHSVSINRGGATDFVSLLTAYSARFPVNIDDIYQAEQGLKQAHQFAMERARSLDQKTMATNALEELLLQKLELDPAAAYWNGKADVHKAAVSTWVACISVTIIVSLGYFFVSGFAKLQELAGTLGSEKGDHWTLFVLVSLPAVFILYLLRQVARLVIFHLQRWGDAQERATLVRTYLALTEQEKRSPTEAERLLVLRQLFRPGPGDAIDDSSQDGLLDQLMKTVGPK